MKYTIILLLMLCLSCGKEKSIQLPEIESSEITTIDDVSAAYIFYNESEKDSVELNRKNLIISTNWLVNVDKRLKLKQAIPSIQILQEKKRSATVHKNEAAKNFYTCNDTAIQNLGFIDFTNTIYHNGIDKAIVENNMLYNSTSSSETNYLLSILFHSNDSISINSAPTNKSEFIGKLAKIDSIQTKIMGIVNLKFNENLTFQEYITYKSMLSKIKLKHAVISDSEYIFN